MSLRTEQLDCKKMDIQRLLRDLRKTIKSNDIQSVRNTLLSNDPELLNHPKSYNVRCMLLSKAINFECKEIIELLIKFPKFIKSKDKINLEQHLVTAIRKGNVRLAEFLLKNGARLDGPEWNGYSTIYRSLFSATNLSTRKEMLTLLTQYGLNTLVKNGRSENLLHQFIKYSLMKRDHDSVDVAEILINSGVPVDEVDYKGYSPLILSVWYENTSLASYLINKVVDVNRKCKHEGSFPLYLATTNGNVELVQMLLENGADVNTKNYFGVTALHRACIYHNERIISLLLKKGACASAQDLRGCTPLSLLNPEKENYDKCVIAMVKQFSKLHFENIQILKSDMDLIQENPTMREHFEKCVTEWQKMSSFKFYSFYTYCAVIQMSRKNVKKLAKLLKNKEFSRKFEENLGKFTYYESDLRIILDEANRVRDESEAVCTRLYSIFKDFLPDIIITKLSKFLVLKNLPSC